MQFTWKQSDCTGRQSLFVMGAGALLAISVIAPLTFWQVRTREANRKMRQYVAAINRLSQLRVDRQRAIADLARNKRLIAWIEARLEDAKINAVPVTLTSFSPETNQADEVVADYLKLSLAEDELNLDDALRRRARLTDEKSLIEQRIVVQESMIQQSRISDF